ncbi:MAG: DUF1572 family protein [Bacteroidia bacterium]|nr:DUF1572 family protein [Bacteroidia bacterium]
METYLSSLKKQLTQYKELAEKTFAQVPEEKLFWQYNPESNSIATIVKHLWGNMLSRWTDFLSADGEKPWRNRDAEFENDIQTRDELLAKWQEGWACVFNALDGLHESHLNQTTYIRAEPHSVVDACNRQLAHYASHVGQIMYIGKMILGAEWTSLSIPKGKSGEFNQEKFSNPQ